MIRKRAKGYYHFVFTLGGRTYSGNTWEKGKKAAEAFEADIRQALGQADTIQALIDIQRELQGQAGDSGDALMQRALSAAPNQAEKKAYARSFAQLLEYMDEKHIRSIRAIDRNLAGEFVGYLVGQGLASGTVARLVSPIRTVIDSMGIEPNPFQGVRLPRPVKHNREPFSRDEIRLIIAQAPEWMRYIVMVGANTGLRLGDICTLRWDEVDFERGVVNKHTRKTGALVSIPMLPGLAGYLADMPAEDNLVYPELANRYTNTSTRSSLGREFGRFLRGIGIDTCNRKLGKYSKPAKDFHSLRHTFICLAADNGVPFNMVQAMVGHMSPSMTAMYAAHATTEDLKRHMEKMPSLG